MCTPVHRLSAMSDPSFQVDPSTSVRSARRDFFAHAGFGTDGGYSEPWSEADFGAVAYRVPNPSARADALRVHDLHHVLTGYGTDWRGEAEISAWELGSGGAGPVGYAWIIALWGLFTGLLVTPGRVFRAFVRGRGSRNLYATGVDEALLELPVGRLARRLAIQPNRPTADDPWAPGTPRRLRLGDGLAFGLWAVAAVASRSRVKIREWRIS